MSESSDSKGKPGKAAGRFRSVAVGARGARAAPTQVNLELTQECNLRCRHCYLEFKQEGGELTTAEWKSVLDQIAGMGTMFVVFTGGEIFCRPDFFEICRRAHDLGLFYHFQTNATFIDAAMADKVMELNPTKVEISIYGASAEVHDAITRVPGSFEKTLDAIRMLRERHVRIIIKTTVMKPNLDDLPAIAALAGRLGLGYVFDPVIMPGVHGSGLPAELRLSDDEMRRFMVDQGWDREPTGEIVEAREALADEDPERRMSCSAARSRFAISATGDVHPCVLWRKSAGNVRRDSLADIWHGELFSGIREIQLNHLYICHSCSIIQTCIRCPAIAYLDSGDVLAEAAENCRINRLLREVQRNAGKKGV